MVSISSWKVTMVDNRSTLGGSFSLGRRTVHRVGLGAMRLMALHHDAASAHRLLRHAVDLGVNHIDTAAYYGDGFVNGLLRDTVASNPDVVVVTKIGAVPAPPGATVPFIPAQRPSELREGVEHNLRTLAVERLDVVNLRRHADADDDQRVSLDDQLDELIGLRQSGLIGGVGLSAVDAATLAKAIPAGIVCVQNQYSLLDRADEPLLATCAQNGIAWVPYFPLGGGGWHPAAANVVEHPDVAAIASVHDVTPAQLGLAWLLQHALSTLLIPGTSTTAHLEANIAAGDIALPAEAIAQLDALAGLLSRRKAPTRDSEDVNLTATQHNSSAERDDNG